MFVLLVNIEWKLIYYWVGWWFIRAVCVSHPPVILIQVRSVVVHFECNLSSRTNRLASPLNHRMPMNNADVRSEPIDGPNVLSNLLSFYFAFSLHPTSPAGYNWIAARICFPTKTLSSSSSSPLLLLLVTGDAASSLPNRSDEQAAFFSSFPFNLSLRQLYNWIWHSLNWVQLKNTAEQTATRVTRTSFISFFFLSSSVMKCHVVFLSHLISLLKYYIRLVSSFFSCVCSNWLFCGCSVSSIPFTWVSLWSII